MKIKPFHFKLEKVDPRQQQILEALFDFLPRTGLRNTFNQAITNALSKHLGIKVSHHLETISQEKFDDFVHKLPDLSSVIVLGMPPRTSKVILEIDPSLAAFFISRLLGEDKSEFPLPKQLSDIEQGVLQYLCLQVLSHIYRLCGKDSRVHFKFEKFITTPMELKDVLPAQNLLFILTIKITIGKYDGFIRLALPSPLIEQLYLNVGAKTEAHQIEKDYLLGQLIDFDHIKMSLWAEAGNTTILAGEIKNLEPGDVILFDKTELKLQNNKLSGNIVLRAGNGKHGGFISKIKTDSKQVHCEIVDVYKGEDIL
ncbi:MAG: hypothetical protein ABH859_02910 [Pseudomonadota bacterium]